MEVPIPDDGSTDAGIDTASRRGARTNTTALAPQLVLSPTGTRRHRDLWRDLCPVQAMRAPGARRDDHGACRQPTSGSGFASSGPAASPKGECLEPLAYIDPGAGSLFIQAVIATVLVVPFFLRSQIRRSLDHLRGRRPAATRAADSAPRDDLAPPAA